MSGFFRRMGTYLQIGCALSVCSVTAFALPAAFRPAAPFVAPPIKAATPAFPSKRLSDHVAQRRSDIDAATRLSQKGASFASNPAKTNLPPVIRLNGIVSSKRGRLAVISLDRLKQSAIVREGDETGGVTVVRIGAEDMTYLWNGHRFTVRLR